MKLQHSAVLFIIIFIPIILVTSYFISLQVNTIKLESEYKDKLLNATYDAMTAFELNTANEDLSSVSDSLRSIIDASNNIFFNTLCTNLGVSNASKSYIQPYIPAIIYTLYDGYYIYAPTNIPEICVDSHGRTIRTSDYGVTKDTTMSGIGIYKFDESSVVYSTANPAEPADDSEQTTSRLTYSAIGDEYDQILYKNNNGTYSTQLHSWGGAKTSDTYKNSTYYKRDYILKSYIPYAAKYSSGDINITVNYTLDNFMTIEGSVKNTYYTKSGYFIDKDLVTKIEVTAPGVNTTITTSNWSEISQEKIDEYISDPSHCTVKVTLNDGNEISNKYGAVDILNVPGNPVSGFTTNYWPDAQSAVKYYADSFIFSCWVYDNLEGVLAKNIQVQYSVSDIQNTAQQTINGTVNTTALAKDMLYDFSNDNDTPFKSSDGTDTVRDPESEISVFYQHKRNVIKNSITYNLLLSMLVYTEESRTVEYNMPVFKESEWDRILNNVSITAFMEGMRCGLKYFNDYAIVTSTNNEISVTENEIFYVPRVRVEGGESYLNDIDNNQALDTTAKIAHRIDCSELILDQYGAISFKSKEIKYDKILDSSGKYIYDHKVYTDYDCIVDSNYTVHTVVPNDDGTYIIDGNKDIKDYLIKNSSDTQIKYKLLAYRIAIAKERNNLYKTTAFPENYGWQVIYLGDKNSGTKKGAGASVTVNLSGLSVTDLSKVKKIEVTIEDAKIQDGSGNPVYGVYTDTIKASFGVKAYSEAQTIATTSSSRRTLEYVQDFDSGSASSLTLTTGNTNTQFTVEAVKVYYK